MLACAQCEAEDNAGLLCELCHGFACTECAPACFRECPRCLHIVCSECWHDAGDELSADDTLLGASTCAPCAR